MSTIKDNAQFAKGCVLNCNSPDLFRATIMTAVTVVIALLVLSLVSIWAVSGRTQVTAVGAATTPMSTETTKQAAGPMLREAVSLHKSCLQELDPELRQRHAQRALELVRSAELMADPETLKRTVGCDTERLAMALLAM
jgi:hypothetical protein